MVLEIRRQQRLGKADPLNAWVALGQMQSLVVFTPLRARYLSRGIKQSSRPEQNLLVIRHAFMNGFNGGVYQQVELLERGPLLFHLQMIEKGQLYQQRQPEYEPRDAVTPVKELPHLAERCTCFAHAICRA